MGELHILYELQQLELKLDKLRKTLKELPVYEEFKTLQNEVADAKEAAGWAENKLEEQRRRIKRLELDAKQAEQETKAVQARLYSGTVKNAKELEQLESKGKALQRDRDKAEENVLLAMEALDDLEKALVKAREGHKNSNRLLHEMKEKGNNEIQELKNQISESQEKRQALSQQVGEPLLARYREMRQRYHGRPLARVEGDNCTGCRVAISSNLKNRLCNPAAVIACENCGRILVPAEL